MAADSGAIHLFIDRAKLTELGDFKLPTPRQIVLDEELDSFMAAPGTRAAPFDPADPAVVDRLATRLIDAAPAKVWDALTNRMGEWWCPRPWRARPGKRLACG